MLHSLWLEALVLHECADLVWNLLEHLLCKVASLHALSELHELDNVSLHFPARSIAETLAISIELLHGIEVGIAHADDDDGAWQS